MVGTMGTKMLRTYIVVLATVLTLTLAVTMPTLAQKRPPVPFGRDHVVYAINHKGVITLQNRPAVEGRDQIVFTITDEGVIDMGGDIRLGKCSDLLRHRDEVRDLEKLGALRACEKAGFTANGSPTQDGVGPQTPLSETGGLPVILIPIALLALSGILIRKSTAP